MASTVEKRQLYSKLYQRGCFYEWAINKPVTRGWYKGDKYLGVDATEAMRTLKEGDSMPKDKNIVVLIDQDELDYASVDFSWVQNLFGGKKRLVGGVSLHGTRHQLLTLAAKIVKEVEEES